MDASKKQREPVAFKSLAELKRFIRPGVELKTVSHANHADMVGLTRVVTTVQTVGFYHCLACTSSPTSCHTCFTARFDRSAFSYWKASWRTCRTARHRQNVSVCPMMRRYIRAYFSKNCDATDLLLAGKG